MNIKIAITFVVMTLFIGSAGIVSSTILAQQSQNAHFIANLSGKSARPPNGPLSTMATGKAIFTMTNYTGTQCIIVRPPSWTCCG